VRPLDAVIVVVLLLLSYWSLWWDWDSYSSHPPHLAVDSVTVAVATLSLLARRHAPLTVLAVTHASLWLPDLVVATGTVLWGEWVPTLLAAHAVAVHRRAALSTVPFVAATVAFTVFAVRFPGDFANPAAALAWFLPLVVAVGVGHVVRRLLVESRWLTSRTEELERSQVARAEQAVAQERARLARELHDVIAHNVSIMIVQAGAAENTLAVDPEAAKRALAHVQDSGREALEEMRLLLGVLREERQGATSLAPTPTLRRLDALAEVMRESGLHVDVRADGLERRIPPESDVSAYRIVQEALTNVLKHAPGARVSVAVCVEPSVLRIEVCDSGGDRRPRTSAGFGLAGLRERAVLHGGTLQAAPDADGFTVRAELPLVSPVHA
jgi:signal transduction histidine kinase